MSETKRDNAQVAEANIETAMHLDKKDFERIGLAMESQGGSDVAVSPMAGMMISAISFALCHAETLVYRC